MKKVQVLAVAMLMVFILAGCGKKSPVGTWESTLDVSAVIEEYVNTQGASGVPTGLDVVVVMEFNEDGNYRFYMDAEASKPSFDAWIGEYATYSADLLYKTYEETYGISKDQADEEMKAQKGMTVDEYIKDLLSTFTIEDMIENGNGKNGTYTYTDTQIFIDGESEPEMDYEVDNKKLNITFKKGESLGSAGFPETMVFTAR